MEEALIILGVTTVLISGFNLIKTINISKPKEQSLNPPNIEEMYCDLGHKFHECDVHRCSTYGCLGCGQYLKT